MHVPPEEQEEVTASTSSCWNEIKEDGKQRLLFSLGSAHPRRNTEEFTASPFRWVLVRDPYQDLLGTTPACAHLGAEVRYTLLRERSKSERHNPKGIAVMDKEVVEPTDFSISNRLSALSLHLEFHCCTAVAEAERRICRKTQYPLPLAGAAQEGWSLSFVRAMVRENSRSLVRHDYTVWC